MVSVTLGLLQPYGLRKDYAQVEKVEAALGFSDLLQWLLY